MQNRMEISTHVDALSNGKKRLLSFFLAYTSDY